MCVAINYRLFLSANAGTRSLELYTHIRYFALRSFLLLPFVILINSANGIAQHEERLQSHVDYLSAPLLQGRQTGKLGQKLAAIYIQNQLDAVLLDPYEVALIQHGGKLVFDFDTLVYRKHFLYKGFTQPEYGVMHVDSFSLLKTSAEGFFIMREMHRNEDAIFLISDWLEFLELFGHEFDAHEVCLVNDLNSQPKHIFVDAKQWKSLPRFTHKFVDKQDILNTENLIYPVYSHPNNTSTWVFCAHYDHLGKSKSGVYYPGADDNASGVALLIELGREIKRAGLQLPMNLTIVFFSAEELGLLGSRYFVEYSPHFDSNTTLCLNFDMVGFVTGNLLRVIQYGAPLKLEFSDSKNILIDWIPQSHFLHEFSSDHLSFVSRGVPALHFFSGLHAFYHTEDDSSDKVNFDNLNGLFNLLSTCLKEMK